MRRMLSVGWSHVITLGLSFQITQSRMIDSINQRKSTRWRSLYIGILFWEISITTIWED
jgi:hypothetical protein